MSRYRLTYKYWNNNSKQLGTRANYETNSQSFSEALDKFYAAEAASDVDIKIIHITSIQKKTLFGWKEI